MAINLLGEGDQGRAHRGEVSRLALVVEEWCFRQETTFARTQRCEDMWHFQRLAVVCSGEGEVHGVGRWGGWTGSSKALSLERKASAPL